VQVGLTVYTGRAPYVRNRTVLVAPSGATAWTYDKSHPVPVLEPYRAGPGVLPTAATPYGRLSSLICYDADFPDLARQGGRNGVDIMLVSANTWAGIRRLHAQNAIFRAVENGYTIVRQASKGKANVVDPQGRTLALDDYFTTDRQTVVASVPTSGTRTVYATLGDTFAWLAVVAALGLPVLALVRRRTAGRHAAVRPSAGPASRGARPAAARPAIRAARATLPPTGTYGPGTAGP
jgi:apolipoprotein N-acyltransferase